MLWRIPLKSRAGRRNCAVAMARTYGRGRAKVWGKQFVPTTPCPHTLQPHRQHRLDHNEPMPVATVAPIRNEEVEGGLGEKVSDRQAAGRRQGWVRTTDDSIKE